MTIFNFIQQTLEENPATRNNDNLLVAIVMKELYGITTLNQMAKSTSVNMYDSISRLRRKAQQLNPNLEPTDSVKGERKKRELRIKEWAKSV